jgi:hypothetical protein
MTYAQQPTRPHLVDGDHMAGPGSTARARLGVGSCWHGRADSVDWRNRLDIRRGQHRAQGAFVNGGVKHGHD